MPELTFSDDFAIMHFRVFCLTERVILPSKVAVSPKRQRFRNLNKVKDQKG